MVTNTFNNGVAANDAKVRSVNDVYGLVEKIARQTIENAKAGRTALDFMNKGTITNGSVLEQAIIKMAESKTYDKNAASDFIASNPSLVVKYFTDWTAKQWDTKIYNNEIKSVLTGATSEADIVAKIINSLYEGEKYEQFTAKKEILTQARTGSKITKAGTATATNKLIELIRNVVYDFTFTNSNYYGVGVTGLKGSCDMNSINIVMGYNIYNLIDLDVLANAFNLSKVDLMAKISVTDDLSGYVYILDENAAGVVNKFREFTTAENAAALCRYYYLTTSEMLYYSPLFKCCYIDATALLAEPQE